MGALGVIILVDRVINIAVKIHFHHKLLTIMSVLSKITNLSWSQQSCQHLRHKTRATIFYAAVPERKFLPAYIIYTYRIHKRYPI